jgi:hypothetical protein
MHTLVLHHFVNEILTEAFVAKEWEDQSTVFDETSDPSAACALFLKIHEYRAVCITFYPFVRK